MLHSLTIYLPAMRDAQDDHQLFIFVNLVYDAIVTDADAPLVLAAA